METDGERQAPPFDELRLGFGKLGAGSPKTPDGLSASGGDAAGWGVPGRGRGWLDKSRDRRSTKAMTARMRSQSILSRMNSVGTRRSNAVAAVDQHRNRQVNEFPGFQMAQILTRRYWSSVELVAIARSGFSQPIRDLFLPKPVTSQ